MSSNYIKYRGKCKEFAEKACEENPELTLVRGHYHCPIWGKQAHWWTVLPDGTIYDPTVKQFPSGGIGDYVPFSGVIPCSNCGKEKPKDEMDLQGNYAFCSYKCYGQFVGVI